MKKFTFFSAILWSAASLFAQGTINFANDSATAFTINNGTGNIEALQEAARFELLVNTFGTSAYDATGWTVLATTTNSARAPFQIFGRVQTNYMTTAGGPMAVYVRGWLLASGDSYETSLHRGQSVVLQLSRSGDPTLVPPGTAAPIFGNFLIPGLVIQIPEPSIGILGLSGCAVVLFWRMRRASPKRKTSAATPQS